MRSDADMNPMQGPGPRCTWLRAASALATGAGLGGRQAAAHAATLEVGHPTPPLVLYTLDGRSIAADNLRGQAIILTFWAMRCSPCRTELPLLSVCVARHADKGLHVLGFSLDEPAELPTVREVAAKPSFPIDLLGNAYMGGYGRIWRLPANFTVGRKDLLADNGQDSHEPAWAAERLERVVAPSLH